MILNSNIREMPEAVIETLPIDSLVSFNSVEDDEFFDKVYDSINREGLRFPLVCWKLEAKKYNNDYYKPWVDSTPTGPRPLIDSFENIKCKFAFLKAEKKYVPDKRMAEDLVFIYAGYNRAMAAKKIGYTEIDCVVYNIYEDGGYTRMLNAEKTCKGWKEFWDG